MLFISQVVQIGKLALMKPGSLPGFVPLEQLQDYCKALVLSCASDGCQRTANRTHVVLYGVTKLKPWEKSHLLSRLVAHSLRVTRGMQQEHIQ